MKKKVFLLFLVVIVFCFLIFGFLASKLATSLYENELQNSLKASAKIISNNIELLCDKENIIDYELKAQDYSELLSNINTNKKILNGVNKIRVTFIDLDGIVLGDSDANYESMENHGNRPEILEAINNEFGSNIRYSKTIKMNFMYVAYYSNSTKLVTRLSVPLVEVIEIYKKIWLITILGCAIGIIITLFISLRLSIYITQPIKSITEMTRDISKGNYSKRVKIYEKNEIGELANNFNAMTNQLEQTINELKDKNAKVDTIINSMTNGIIAVDKEQRVVLINPIVYDIFNVELSENDIIDTQLIEIVRNSTLNDMLLTTVEENVSLMREIHLFDRVKRILQIYTCPIKAFEDNHKNAGGIAFINDITEFKKLEDIRSEFVSNVTHELKTPLTSIRGFIETLRSGAMKDEKVAENFLEIIDIEAERLSILINDILQLSEIETLDKDTNTTVFNLDDLVQEVVEILLSSAYKKDVSINYNIDREIQLKANRNRIKQLLINLIDNAIKYNKTNGIININGQYDKGKVLITIKDTGIGIPDEHIPRIFERFYRVDKGRSRSMGGTGLGLSIVKHIVNLYGGSINVSSTINEGTEFFIRFPKTN